MSANTGDTTGISVVIRTFNSARTLEQVISALAPSGQDEILIIDSGSTDSTVEIAKRQRTRLVPFTGTFNYSRSLNLGFESARNGWVLVLSSHCIPMHPEHLPRMHRVLAGFPLTTALAYFPTVLTSVPTPPKESAQLFTQQEWEKNRVLLGGNTHALYRVECWRQHRFNETLTASEDAEWFLWAIRSGYSAAQCSGPAVLYRHQANMRRMFAKGLVEARAARAMLGWGGLNFHDLCRGLGSHLKNALRKRIPLRTWLGQSAHHLGVFLGSRGAVPPNGR